MTSAREPDQHRPGEKPERSIDDAPWGSVERRRARVHAQVERARRGDHKVPTWALAVLLGLILAGWLYLIFFD
jgi:hypothetical protein